jgi:hypothetical protein
VKITVADCLNAGFCLRGQKAFCRNHGIDFRTFVRDGMDEEEFAGIDDANLSRVIAAMKQKKGI